MQKQKEGRDRNDIKHPARTGAQCVVDGLAKEGCEVLFGYPGGAVLDIFNSLYDAPFQFVLSRHEQGAVHMADGYARATGKVGCCMVTSGPGATNTVTGLATACMDGIPLVCMSGQVPLSMIGNDAFQEADVVGITRPVTKHNFLVRNVDELPDIIAQAFYIASSGKPGPVVVDIPKDIQKQSTTRPVPEKVDMRAYKPHVDFDVDAVAELAGMINKASSPVLYVGGGTIAGNAAGEITDLARKARIPVVTTLMGMGAFPGDDPLALGMLGMHGSVAANYAVDKCDLLISAGARFDDRVTGNISEFAKKAEIVHIDIDRSAIGKSVRCDLGIEGYLKPVVTSLILQVEKVENREWAETTLRWKERHPFTYPEKGDVIMPQYVIERIYEVSGGKATIVSDVGQHQMWAAQHYFYTRPRSFLSSGGLGTMGFGLPAAIGAKFACPDDLVVCVTGDGGVQMNFQELVVAVEHKRPVVVVILNNSFLGMVRQWQEMFYDQRYSGVTLKQKGRKRMEMIEEAAGYLPDFIKLCEAHGAKGKRIFTRDEVDSALKEAFESGETCVIECIVDPEANVFPMIPPGQAVSAMITSLV
ncbi:MAG: biosynthetic-type acetolactate synthase large subunit [Kiritimatiellia bacterium]